MGENKNKISSSQTLQRRRGPLHQRCYLWTPKRFVALHRKGTKRIQELTGPSQGRQPHEGRELKCKRARGKRSGVRWRARSLLQARRLLPLFKLLWNQSRVHRWRRSSKWKFFFCSFFFFFFFLEKRRRMGIGIQNRVIISGKWAHGMGSSKGPTIQLARHISAPKPI